MSNEQTKIIKEWEALQAQIREHDAKAVHHAKLARNLSEEAEKLLRFYAVRLAESFNVTKGLVYERDDKSRWQVSHAFPQCAELHGEHVILVRIYMTGLTKTGKQKTITTTPLLQQLIESNTLPPINDALPRFTLVSGIDSTIKEGA